MSKDPSPGVVCVDLGTTNTRVWLVDPGGRVVARAAEQVGVRDTARDGSAVRLRDTLRSLIDRVTREPPAGPKPRCVVAAGMITSSLGLLEIPHLPAPAGLSELAAGTKAHSFPDVTPLPVFLVPGVRTGGDLPAATASTVSRFDLMRGEETFCVGLQTLGLVAGEAAVLNLGSHWKLIRLDAAGRVAGSTTSLAGEMIHAVGTTTILSGALPQARPAELEADWVAAGMAEQRRSGLGRALFCTRLLQLAGRTTPDQRLAFVTGCFIASELDPMLARGDISPHAPLVIAGHPATAAAWQAALAGAGVRAAVLGEDLVEAATLAGLLRILEAARQLVSPS